MCLLATCGIFWTEDLLLRELTCPCGYRYWDFFQERFVDGPSRTFNAAGRALPMEDREATLKATMLPEVFEASIRAQFMVHCFGCGIRRRIDEGVPGAGFDPKSFLRAMAELQEIGDGNYTGRGCTMTFQAVPATLPIRSQEAAGRVRRPSSSSSTADPTRPLRNPLVPEVNRQSLRSTPKAQQDTTLARVSSNDGGSRTGSGSQRGPPRAPPPGILPSEDAGPVNTGFKSRTVRSSEEPGPDTQPSPRSSRLESGSSTTLVDDDDDGDESVQDSDAPRSTFSNLLAKFVAFADNQYASIATFCENHPEIWEEDTSSLYTAIQYYFRRGEAEPARRLAQRYFMLTLSWRNSESPEDHQTWLNQLGRSRRLREELDEKVKTLLRTFR